MAENIPVREAIFHPHSFGDPGLRLFRWRGEMYRAVRSDRAPLVKELFRVGMIQRLSESGLLIDTEIAPLTIDGYEMVLHHRTLPFVSYPNEWCPTMFRDAVLTLLNLGIALAQHGYTLGDAHPWNLLIDIDRYCSPVFVDLGSIVPIYGPEWPAYDEFCRYCYYPLILMAHGEDQIARLLMWEDSGVSREQVVKLAGSSSLSGSAPRGLPLSRLSSGARRLFPERFRGPVKRKVNSLLSHIHGRNREKKGDDGFTGQLTMKSHLHFLHQVKGNIEAVALDPPPAVHAGKPGPAGEQPGGGIACVQRILNELRPSSVLSIGADGEDCARLTATLGSRVVVFENDIASVRRLYNDARSERLPILPLVMDSTKPTPARGFQDHWSIAATGRFRCEMVLALSAVRRIVAERSLRFDQILEGLSSFSSKWLLVEFTPFDDAGQSMLQKDRLSWYRLDNFDDSLRNVFHTVTRIREYPGPGALFLCEK